MAISTNAHVQAKCEAEGGRANVFLEMFLAEVAEFIQHADNDRGSPIPDAIKGKSRTAQLPTPKFQPNKQIESTCTCWSLLGVV